MLILQNINYVHPDREPLFNNINLTVNRHDKLALIGNNGTGKSTLLKIIAGDLESSGGHMQLDERPYYVPQIFGQFNHLTIAQALGVEEKLHALKDVLNGNVSEKNMDILGEDWTIEERCIEALAYWQMEGLDLGKQLEVLSGGQKTKVFLAGINIHQPNFILLDEPSNHLDSVARELLYQYIQSKSSTMIVISHDRQLLNLLNQVAELSRNGISMYGGNYEFYVRQKQIEQQALKEHIHDQEKALRKAREKQRESIERQQKLDARGKSKQQKAGVARIMMNTLRNSAENSTAKIRGAHDEKMEAIADNLQELRATVPEMDKMKLGFTDTDLHQGRILINAENINYKYSEHYTWEQPLNFEIASGERILLAGANGSGKTTLINLSLGNIEPHTGKIYRAINNAVYIDQDYSLINDSLTIFGQLTQFNTGRLQDHELKIRLNRFLFNKQDWNKSCSVLSGGEKMRLILCCLTVSDRAPDLIILDEPTNNLDIQNIRILTNAINQYRGALIVVSHDAVFAREINVQRKILI